MTRQEIAEISGKQKEFFSSGKTLDVKTRKEYLIKLKESIRAHEKDIAAALKQDLGKSEEESYMCEIGLTLNELSYQIKHINKFAKRRKVPTPLTQQLSTSFLYPSPYGRVLIISPWNYPFLLSLEPLSEAVAAGNTVILKPSAYSPASSRIITEIINEVFPEEYVAVINGGRKENESLLSIKFDYIFFTGSKSVGKLVYESAAKNMTPVTLELGGKSPCIIDDSADIKLAARRIVFGKFLNCGQTCVAPDYILCKKEIKEKFISAVKDEITRQFGKEPLKNPDYGKIITKKHFDRIISLINKDKTVVGGETDEENLKIAPTVMDEVTEDDAVMQEEIFGPVMPVLTFEDTDEVIKFINSSDAPLALYIFSQNKETREKFLSSVQFGGGCVNDVIIHLATPYMPFGGVKESGIGSYHGKKGFETFTHYKSIIDKKNVTDLPMRYQPYKKFFYKLIRLFLR